MRIYIEKPKVTIHSLGGLDLFPIELILVGDGEVVCNFQSATFRGHTYYGAIRLDSNFNVTYSFIRVKSSSIQATGAVSKKITNEIVKPVVQWIGNNPDSMFYANRANINNEILSAELAVDKAKQELSKREKELNDLLEKETALG